MATTFEIRAYAVSKGGHGEAEAGKWGYIDLSWEASGESAEAVLENEAVHGDWSEFEADELCKLVAFDADGDEVDDLIFSPHNSSCDKCGAEGLEFGDLLTLENGDRICGRCEHAAEAAAK